MKVTTVKTEVDINQFFFYKPRTRFYIKTYLTILTALNWCPFVITQFKTTGSFMNS